MGNAQTPAQYCQAKCNDIGWSRYGKSVNLPGYSPNTFSTSCLSAYQTTGTTRLCYCTEMVARNSVYGTLSPWGPLPQSYYQQPSFKVNADGTVIPVSSGYMYPAYTVVQRAEVSSSSSKGNTVSPAVLVAVILAIVVLFALLATSGFILFRRIKQRRGAAKADTTPYTLRTDA